MRKVTGIALTALFWIGAAVYIPWSARQSSLKADSVIIDTVAVRIDSPGNGSILTDDMIRGMIDDAGLDPIGKRAGMIYANDYRKAILSNPFVSEASVLLLSNGRMAIDISQRRPIMRIMTDSGRRLYITQDRHAVPAATYARCYVPVVTGEFTLPFPADYHGPVDGQPQDSETARAQAFLSDLIEFVEFVNGDSFWSAEIVQIIVHGASGRSVPEVDIIPRIGEHTVHLGPLEGYRTKLARLLTFYRNAKSWEGWNSGGYIDLTFDSQVVCSM